MLPLLVEAISSNQGLTGARTLSRLVGALDAIVQREEAREPNNADDDKGMAHDGAQSHRHMMVLRAEVRPLLLELSPTVLRVARGWGGHGHGGQHAVGGRERWRSGGNREEAKGGNRSAVGRAPDLFLLLQVSRSKQLCVAGMVVCGGTCKGPLTVSPHTAHS